MQVADLSLCFAQGSAWADEPFVHRWASRMDGMLRQSFFLLLKPSICSWENKCGKRRVNSLLHCSFACFLLLKTKNPTCNLVVALDNVD